MNPLTGYGGNSAIESAGMLADLLKETLDQHPKPDNETLRKIFLEFQEARKHRTTKLMNATKSQQRMEVLDNPFLKYLQLNIVTKMGHEHLAPLIVSAATPGRKLKHLPDDFERGPVLADEEVNANPHERSAILTRFWVASMLLIASLAPITSWYFGIKKIPDQKSRVLSIYVYMTTIAINGLWVVESYRPARFITLIFR